MAAIRNRDALARRLKDIERERELVRAEIEAVRRRMRSLAGAEPWSGEPRLREAVLPPGYSATTTDSGASEWDGAGASAPDDAIALDFEPGPDGLNIKRVVMPQLERTDLLRPALDPIPRARVAQPEHDRFRNYFGTTGLKRVRESRQERGNSRARAVFMLLMVLVLGFILFKMVT